MKIEYRFATINDVDQLVKLRTLMQLEVNNYKPEDVTAEFIEKVKTYFLNSIPTKKYYSSVAIYEEKIIGTAGVCFYEKPPSLSGGFGLNGYVTNVYVEKDFRQKGVGSQMMRELNQLAFEMKADKLHLGATADGLSIYKAVGYQKPNFVNLEIKTPFKEKRSVNNE